MERKIEVILMIKIEDSQLMIDNKLWQKDNLIFIEEISRGANGIVFLAEDPFLERKVAFKIWNKIRPSDIRDKYKQGLLEARKALHAKNLTISWHDPKLDDPYFISDESDILSIDNIVGDIYYAGNAYGYFYTVMEYIEGLTLKNILESEPQNIPLDLKAMMNWSDSGMLPLGVKVNMALRLCEYNEAFFSNDIIHGDLHWKNVMICNLCRTNKYGDELFTYDMKIIDFGTSYFSGEEVGAERNFSTLIETINRCIFPFRLDDIMASPKPTDNRNFSHWIKKQLYAIRAGFYELGQEYVGWPLYYSYGTYQLTTKGFGIDLTTVKAMIRQYEQEKRVILDKKYLGSSRNWDTFDGRFAIRRD